MKLDHRRTASAWHDEQWSPIYVYASTGMVARGLDVEIRRNLDAIEAGILDHRDAVGEHLRLSAFLDHVLPDLASLEAEHMGRAEGYAAAAEWTADVLAGPWPDRLTAVAARIESRLGDRPPARLDELPKPPSSSHNVRRIELDCLWPQPDLDDVDAHARWSAARRGVWSSYESSFNSAVLETVRARCQEILNGVPARPPGLQEEDLASARFIGADFALSKAASLNLTRSQAQAIINGNLDVQPPAYGTEIARRCVDSDVRAVASEETLMAMDRLLDQAWAAGSDLVWQRALVASARHALGDTSGASRLDQANEGLWQELLSDIGSRGDSESLPYVRPASPVGDSPSYLDLPTCPEGWAVEPAGDWHGELHEVVYEPRRFEVTITSTSTTDLSAVPGWALRDTDGVRKLWVLDRATAARKQLDVFAERAQAVEAVSLDPTHGEPSSGPSLEL